MKGKKLLVLWTSALVVCLASFAWANIPSMSESYATSETEAKAQVSCLVCPLGDGTAMTSCYEFGLGLVGNGQIDLYLRDANGDPVYPYPKEDLWIETGACVEGYPGIVLCYKGSTADSDTDASGHTAWTQPLEAGCCGCQVIVMVSGMALAQLPFDNYLFNSPDMNCDLIVNLTDIVLFAGPYYGVYNYCADFYWDGALNLSDIVILAQHVGHTCP